MLVYQRVTTIETQSQTLQVELRHEVVGGFWLCYALLPFLGRKNPGSERNQPEMIALICLIFPSPAFMDVQPGCSPLLWWML